MLAANVARQRQLFVDSISTEIKAELVYLDMRMELCGAEAMDDTHERREDWVGILTEDYGFFFFHRVVTILLLDAMHQAGPS